MASPPRTWANARSYHPPRPLQPQRTLSSSLRLYSSPLVPRVPPRSKTFHSNGRLSPTHEAHEAHEASESDPLLRSPPARRSMSAPSVAAGSVIGTELEDADEDADADVEAEMSDDQADSDGLYPPHCCWTTENVLPPKRSDPFGNWECDVYGNIHRVRQEIINSIDDPYSLDQLKAPRMNISVVRPLVEKFYTKQDLSLIFCLLVNRAQFIREQSYAAHHQTVNLTRALLCELLAEKVLRRYNEFNPGPRGLLKLANILVASFDAFQGAPESIMNDSPVASAIASRRASRRRHHHKLTALEVAIVSESKSFLASTACQKVVDAIYRGKIVYSPSSYIDIIPDHWKKRPISLYDPRRAPVLNQYRLVVPRTRSWIEVTQFTVLLLLYVAVMTTRESRNTTTYTVLEAVFDLYACGWILDQVSSILEHGWHVYTQNLWSFLDVMFSIIFLAYLPLRLHGWRTSGNDNDQLGVTALDILSCAAPVLIPRLAFNIMSENMLFLSLRAMMGDFITLTALAIWCFAGFLLSLKWLHNGLHDSITISKWMIFVWFGLDGTGINESPTFHKYLGPALMVLFAFLGNTLFLTILVSMLSNTFSMISANAVQEIQYRRSVLTFLGVKSDAIFAFMPPFNLLALAVFAPLKFLLSPRRFHTVFVFMVRVVNLPTLIILSWYERNTLWVSSRYVYIRPRRIDWKHQTGPRVISTGWWSSTLQSWDLQQFSAHGDIQAVFESDPPDYILQEDDANQDNDPTQPNDTAQPKMDADEFDDLEPLAPMPGRTPKERFHAQFRMPFLSTSPQVLSPTTERENPTIKFASNTAIVTTDNESTSSPVTPRKPRSPLPTATATATTTATNTAPPTPHPDILTNRDSVSIPKHKKRRRHRRVRSPTTADAALRAEFHDSEDEQEALNRRKSRAFPMGNTKGGALKRFERKDSMIDYDPGDVVAVEANARLGTLERRLTRIEELLVRVVKVANGDIPNEGSGVGTGLGNGEIDGVGRALNAAAHAGLTGARGVAAVAALEDEIEKGERTCGEDRSGSDAEIEQALRNDVQKEMGT